MARLLTPLAALLMLALAPAAQATDRYVEKTGNLGSMSCAANNPCLTLQQAFTQAATGDTIYIGAGTWSEARSTGNETLHLVGKGAGSPDAFDAATQTRILGGVRFEAGGSARGIRFEANNQIALWLAALSGSQSYVVEDVVAIGQMTGVTTYGPLQVGGPGTIDADVRRTTATMVSNVDNVPAVRVVGSTLRTEGSTFRADGTVAVQAATNSTLTLTRSTVTGAIGVNADNSQATIDRSRISGRSSGITIFSGSSSSTATVTDSLLTLAPNPIPSAHLVALRGGNAGRTSTLNLRRSTAVADGPNVRAGILLDIATPGAVALNLDGSAVRASDADAATGDPDIATTGNAGTATSSAAYSSFNDVSGPGTPQPGSGTNVAGDPLLAADGTPGAGSPLIDRGDPAGAPAGSLDLAGAARVQDGDGDAACAAVLDIGAFERAAATCVTPGGGGPGGGGPAPDTTAPVFTAVGMTNKVFAPRRRAATAARAKRGTTYRWTLSEPATTTIRVQKRVRRRGKIRWRRVGTLTRTAKAGRNKLAFSGHLRKRALKPGRYRARFRAVDGAKNPGAGPTLKFRIVRP